jgi:uncharacterized protein YdeI (YjbR/CyaY-like superfamily)
MPTKPLEIHSFATRAAWHNWLARHHTTSPGIAMRIARRSIATAALTYADAVEVALAWGWIDGRKGRGDATAWLQHFSPRGPRSKWSKINRDKALALIARGAMQPSGLAAIERAKASGMWDAAYDAPRTATLPDDFTAALSRAPRAKAFFATIDARNRYAILHRIQTAKLPATRARRIADFVAMLARHELLYEKGSTKARSLSRSR